MHFAAVLEHSPKPGLFEAELSFDHPKWVLYFGADVSFGSFDQIIWPQLRTRSKLVAIDNAFLATRG